MLFVPCPGTLRCLERASRRVTAHRTISFWVLCPPLLCRGGRARHAHFALAVLLFLFQWAKARVLHMWCKRAKVMYPCAPWSATTTSSCYDHRQHTCWCPQMANNISRQCQESLSLLMGTSKSVPWCDRIVRYSMYVCCRFAEGNCIWTPCNSLSTAGTLFTNPWCLRMLWRWL